MGSATALIDESRVEQARRNRERMPNTANIVDEFREVFGAGVRLTWAKEGDCVVGKPIEVEA